jgi:hypothetical protein
MMILVWFKIQKFPLRVVDMMRTFWITTPAR